MKMMKKLSALALAVVMMLAMTVTAFAQEVHTGIKEENGSSITVRNPKVGKTYTLYKLFNATEQGTGEDLKISYTLLPGMTAKDLGGTGFSADANGNVTDAQGKGATLTPGEATALKTLATTKGDKIGETVTSDGSELVFDQLDYGYYLVVSSVGSLVSINSTTPDMVIYDKNPSAPTKPENGDAKTVNDTMVQVGQRVDYTITFYTTNYETVEEQTPTKITEYIVTDSNSGFLSEITVDSVKVGGTTLTAGTEYTDNLATTGTITIPWTNTTTGAHLYKDGATLEVKYHATVNSSATVTTANTNTVKLTWTGNNTGLTDTEDVFTGSIEINKYAGTDESAHLANAQFVLLDKAVGTDGKVPADAKYYTVDADGTIGTTTNVAEAKVLTTDRNGKATITGLEPGKKYYLLETVAPDGYNKLVGTTEVEIPAVNDDKSNVAQLAQVKAISNNAGVALPSTGGIGTTIFYVVGGILVAAAVVLLVTKKRMSNRA